MHQHYTFVTKSICAHCAKVLGWTFLQIKILPFRDRKKDPSERCGGPWLHGLFAVLAISQITAHIPLKVPVHLCHLLDYSVPACRMNALWDHFCVFTATSNWKKHGRSTLQSCLLHLIWTTDVLVS